MARAWGQEIIKDHCEFLVCPHFRGTNTIKAEISKIRGEDEMVPLCDRVFAGILQELIGTILQV